MKNGILILDKGQNMTSFAAVRRVQRLLGADKAGHTGTLDPMATGVLPILIGRSVKLSEYLLTGEKHYVATLRLGLTTDTEDVTGKVLSTCDLLPPEEKVRDVCSSFVGRILQTPPMYSALKIGGKKLVDLARAGISVEREPRPITVFRLGVEKLTDREYSLDVLCSKGTYIRTLCADIGAALGVGGVMASLRRVSAGGFTLADAHTLEQLEAMTPEQRDAVVFPPETLFLSDPAVVLPPFFARLARSGQTILQKKIGAHFDENQRVRLYDGETFFAIGEAVMTADGPAVKPIKQIEL